MVFVFNYFPGSRKSLIGSGDHFSDAMSFKSVADEMLTSGNRTPQSNGDMNRNTIYGRYGEAIQKNY